MTSRTSRRLATVGVLLALTCVAQVQASTSTPTAPAHHSTHAHPGMHAPASQNPVLDAVNQDMHFSMAAVELTGRFDQDFLASMIPHHEGAVAMAKAVLSAGKDPKVQELANAVVDAQAREIAWMKRKLATLASDAPVSEQGKAGLEHANAAMHAAMGAVALTGDMDLDFVQSMIPHHEGAVAMAELVLRHSKDVELIQLARDIQSAQRSEIAWMKDKARELQAAHTPAAHVH